MHLPSFFVTALSSICTKSLGRLLAVSLCLSYFQCPVRIKYFKYRNVKFLFDCKYYTLVPILIKTSLFSCRIHGIFCICLYRRSLESFFHLKFLAFTVILNIAYDLNIKSDLVLSCDL